MAASNTILIHAAPAGSRRAPLFLIHDGGGTIFHYFLLKPLNRAVYGIRNPRCQPGQEWEGGLHQMADEYLSLIKPVAQRRPILLGGWSLGGLVALEMARIAADNPLDNPPIVGLVLIDSTFPHPLGLAPDVKRVPYEVDFDEHVKPEIKAMVQHCMAQTDQLIGSWHPPSWESSTAAAAAQGSNAAGDSEPDGSVGTKLLPPPAILLRAREPVPEPPCQPGVRNVTDIDLARDRRFLGWEDYQFKFLRNVLDVNGHHHNIFDQKNIASVDAKLKMACKMLDPGL